MSCEASLTVLHHLAGAVNREHGHEAAYVCGWKPELQHYSLDLGTRIASIPQHASNIPGSFDSQTTHFDTQIGAEIFWLRFWQLIDLS